MRLYCIIAEENSGSDAITGRTTPVLDGDALAVEDDDEGSKRGCSLGRTTTSGSEMRDGRRK